MSRRFINASLPQIAGDGAGLIVYQSLIRETQ
jgi:hypothetical protein